MGISTALPLFLILNITPWLFVALAFNLLYDSLVLNVLFNIIGVKLKKDVNIRTTMMVWVFGFVADIIGIVILMLLIALVPGVDAYNPYYSIQGVIVFLVALIITMLVSYSIYDYLLGKVYVSKRKRFRIIMWMILLTAPYYMMIPVSIHVNSFF